MPINRNIQRATKDSALNLVANVSTFEQDIPKMFRELESAKTASYPNCDVSFQHLSTVITNFRDTWITERFTNPDIPNADTIDVLIKNIIQDANTIIQFSLTKGYIDGELPDVGNLTDGDVASVVGASVSLIRTLSEHYYSVGANVDDACPSKVVVSDLDRAFKVTSPEDIVASSDPSDSDGKPRSITSRNKNLIPE